MERKQGHKAVAREEGWSEVLSQTVVKHSWNCGQIWLTGWKKSELKEASVKIIIPTKLIKNALIEG